MATFSDSIRKVQRFFESARSPIVCVGTSGNVLEWNSKMSDITGIARNEAFGKDFAQTFVNFDSRELVVNGVSAALSREGSSQIEFTLALQDGRRIDMIASSSSWLDDDGKVVGAVLLAHDITDRKRLEVDKTSLAQELQTFIDTANAPIFGIDANGLVNEWNNKSAEITGFCREEVMGKHLVQVRSKSLIDIV